MTGPVSVREWMAAYQVVFHVMGLGERNALSKFIVHAYPEVSRLSDLPLHSPKL
jgi:hypothetical protein